MYKLILSFISGFLTKAYFTSIALKFIKVLLFFKKNETDSEFKFYCQKVLKHVRGIASGEGSPGLAPPRAQGPAGEVCGRHRRTSQGGS